MFQIHYQTPGGKWVILYPENEHEITAMLKKLAARRVGSDLRVSTQGTRRCGGTEPMWEEKPEGKYIWWFERGPIEMRL